mmetsp:Transcript_20999/g.44722  ORF Transcript_20999/g.44722 Transcript_20999/m.44722 type:complete len:262 (+) Transcript_20999:169-954(+)
MAAAGVCRVAAESELGCGEREGEKSPLDDRGGISASASDPSDSEGPEVDSDSDRGHRFQREDTAIILDWDDTVLPSSWISEQGLRLDSAGPMNGWQQEELSSLSLLAVETLRLTKEVGNVVLVTNAERGWVELSCLKFLPILYPMLESVKIMSARSEYESPDLSSPFEWKLRAFESEISRIFCSDLSTERPKNVVSLGDSLHEREALIQATAHLPNCRTKSLKFVERPGMEQLRKQHLMLARCLRKIVHHDGNLDLSIRPA